MMSAEDSPVKENITNINQNAENLPSQTVNESLFFPTSNATSPTDELVVTPDSSLLASLRGDDDFNLDTKDLVIKVDNPEKHSSTIDSYITFCIVTKTSRAEYEEHEYSVRRRYSDFIWLRSRLEAEHPTHIIPPLPEKHSLNRFSRFSANFIKTRMFALNKFLQRVAEHPVLSFNKNFKVFLTVEAWEFTAYRKQGASLMSRVTDSFHNMATTYMMKERNPEFQDINTYVTKLSEKVGVLERISQRIQKEEQDYVTDLEEYHSSLSLWSGSEGKVQKGMIALATGVSNCAKALNEKVEDSEISLNTPLREYGLYTEAVKDVIKRRDAIQMEYEFTVDELNKKRAERDQDNEASRYSVSTLLNRNTEEAKQERKDKLDLLIHELIGQVEVNNDKEQVANEDLRADIDRWQNDKEKDIQNIFTHLANKQIEYYENCLSFWSEAIVDVKNCEKLDNQDLDNKPENRD